MSKDAKKVSWFLEDKNIKDKEWEQLESPRQQEVEERFETAEEAVRIVRRFTSTKNKQQRKHQIVDLCTDIATLLDAKKRLEKLVKTQNEELVLLRGQLQVSSEQRESSSPAPRTASSGFSELPPTTFTAGDLASLVLPTSSEVSPAPTPSSGRSTWLCDRGTDPLYPWPQVVTTEPSNRSDSSTEPPSLPSQSNTPTGEPPNRSDSTSPSSSQSSSTTLAGEAVEPPNRSDSSSSLLSQLSSTTPSGVGEVVEQSSEGTGIEENNYESDFESESATKEEEERNIERGDHQGNEERFSDKENTERTEDIESENKNSKDNQSQPSQQNSPKRSRNSTKSSESKGNVTSVRKSTEAKQRSSKTSTRKTSSQKENKLNPKAARVEGKNYSVNTAERKKAEKQSQKRLTRDRKPQTMSKGNDIQPFDTRENSNGAGTMTSSRDSRKNSGRLASSRGHCSTRKSSTKSYKESQWSDSSSGSEDSEDDVRRKVQMEHSTEYWEIYKLIKYLRIGNPTATVIVLCALRDLNLRNEFNQQTLMELGGVLLLVNLLKTKEQRCKIGSLQVLRDITNEKRINTEVFLLGGVNQLVECLDSECKQMQSLAAEVLAQVVTFKKAYSGVRRTGGIQKLIKLLMPSKPNRSKSWQRYNQDPNLCRNTCMALWSCSRSFKNIQIIRNAGAVPLLRMLLDSASDDVIMPTVGIIQECSNDSAFREDIRKEQMIERIVKHFKCGNVELKTLCAKTIEKCAEDGNTRELVRRKGGLQEMVSLISSPNSSVDKELLAAAVGALWKCSINQSNMHKLEEMGALNAIIRLLKDNQPHLVAAKLLGALREFCHHRRNLLTILEQKVLQHLVTLLNLTEPSVLAGTCHVIAICCRDATCRRVILDSDGLRLLWSALKFQHTKICTSSMDAIAECTADPQESAQIVRSFVGGLEMVTKLLRSDLREVQLSTTKAVINIGKDRENLSIMTDYEVVPLLIRLTYAEDEEFRTCVAEAIATCCGLEKNVTAFSSAVIPLAEGVKVFKGVAVQRATARALEQLSQDTHNCCIMHQYGILKQLIAMTGSTDEVLQEAAAKCIKNIRINVLKTLQS